MKLSWFDRTMWWLSAILAGVALAVTGLALYEGWWLSAIGGAVLCTMNVLGCYVIEDIARNG